MGMPYIGIREHTAGVAMLQTVEDNMKTFTPQEIKDATVAREEQAKLGHPSDATANAQTGELKFIIKLPCDYSSPY